MALSKETTLQIFGSIMKDPSILGNTDKYRLSPDDFQNSFERYIFGAIYNIFTTGAKSISVIDIDNYLSEHKTVYNNFLKNNGIEYLQDAEDLSNKDNFDYYYNKLKKYNAIRDLKKIGFDTSNIYPEDLLDDNSDKKLENFEQMSVQDIFHNIKAELSKTESNYLSSQSKEIKASNNIFNLIKKLKETPEVGLNLQGEIFNTISRGARKGKFYIRTAGTGVGKTRNMIGDACYLAYPIRYNIKEERWENCGSCSKVLYVGVEQEPEEIQTMILAYLSGINEEKILFGFYNEEEEEILKIAAKIMEIYSENFHIVQLPNPNIQSIKTTIRKYCLYNNTEYVFYDYIATSPSLLNEFRDLKVREDICLTMLSTALKDLAVELDVFMLSSTQVNGDLENKKGIKDQTVIRG